MVAMQRHRHGEGFTITEAVVVMVVTTVVMALLLPGLGRARDSARTAQGLANLQQLGQGVYIMAIDLNNTLPIGYWTGRPLGDARPPGPLETDWMIVLNDYLVGGGDTYQALAVGSRQNDTLPIFRDPNATYPDQGLHHYIGHPVLLPDKDVVDDVSNPRVRAVVRYRLTRIRRPDEVVLAMDGIQMFRQPTAGMTASLSPEAIYRFQYGTAATANHMDNGALNNQSGNFLNSAFYDEGDADLNNLINPGPNQDGTTNGNPANAFNVRWRQNNNTAANFVFPDGHSETMNMNNVRTRNIRVDR